MAAPAKAELQRMFTAYPHSLFAQWISTVYVVSCQFVNALRTGMAASVQRCCERICDRYNP